MVEPESGRIWQSTLNASVDAIKVQLTTDYAFDERLGLLLPVVFRERYEQGTVTISRKSGSPDPTDRSRSGRRGRPVFELPALRSAVADPMRRSTGPLTPRMRIDAFIADLRHAARGLWRDTATSVAAVADSRHRDRRDDLDVRAGARHPAAPVAGACPGAARPLVEGPAVGRLRASSIRRSRNRCRGARQPAARGGRGPRRERCRSRVVRRRRERELRAQRLRDRPLLRGARRRAGARPRPAR